MGKPPRPGVSKRAEQVDDAQRVMVIRLEWCDETHRIARGNIPQEQRFAVRKALGMTLSDMLEAFDTDTIAVLVWLSKRMHGKPSLSWAQFSTTWPDPLEPGSISIWGEDAAGNRIDDEGNFVDEDGNRLDAEPDPVEVDDPES
jgi:hypothetical protein